MTSGDWRGREVRQIEDRREHAALDVDGACAILDALPDLLQPLAAADPQLRRRLYDAFRLNAEIDGNAGQLRLKALVSGAFTQEPATSKISRSPKVDSGGGIRTRDLRVMSPTSYQTAPPRGGPTH